MISNGSQVFLCDVPIRYDTYEGCSHGCKYCFAQRKIDISYIKPLSNLNQLEKFINKERAKLVSWCDWDIPLHWGGMSDPFQPIELKEQVSYKSLKIFEKYKYPVIISTKGTEILNSSKYLDILKNCNAVLQISMVSSKLDKYELGAPSFNKRLTSLETFQKHCKRLIVRIQPYFHECLLDIIEILPAYKKMGVHGIILEGIKYFSKINGTVKFFGDYVLKYENLKKEFELIKKHAHDNGLAFYCGENRLRSLGDSLTCCGCDNMEGFVVNKANLNYYKFDKNQFKITNNMKIKETGSCFRSLVQSKSMLVKVVDNSSYEEIFNKLLNSKYINNVG